MADWLLPSLLARASHLASERFYRVLKRQGIPVREWRVLAALSDNEGITLGELAEIILVEQSSTSRLIDRMEERGLVERTATATDNRKSVIYITKKGHTQVKNLVAQAIEIEEDFIKQFGVRRGNKLKKDLLDIITALKTLNSN